MNTSKCVYEDKLSFVRCCCWFFFFVFQMLLMSHPQLPVWRHGFDRFLVNRRISKEVPLHILFYSRVYGQLYGPLSLLLNLLHVRHTHLILTLKQPKLSQRTIRHDAARGICTKKQVCGRLIILVSMYILTFIYMF